MRDPYYAQPLVLCYSSSDEQQGGMVTRRCVTMCPDWRMVTQHRVTMPPLD